jgi:xylan 1,4-beta-xylosidase
MKCVIDTAGAVTPFAHFWEECVGSCHAALGNREDWRRQLRQCREELGFRRVRFHGILDDDMSVFGRRAGHGHYSFHNIDLIFDYLLHIGMKPFVELGFMPEGMASGTNTVFHYKGNVTPPADWREWEALVETLARHLVGRYGAPEVSAWPFEVWNEPNLPVFWTGSREDYFKLYRHAARALKRVDHRIPVGGPATARNEWIPEIRSFCESTGTPLDFISTHHYPTDDAVDHGADMEAQMAAAGRAVLRGMAEKARVEAGRLPLYYTEWSNSPSSRDPSHDRPYAAAFIVKSVLDVAGLVDMYSFWAFSDIFEEEWFPSEPFHGGFGLLSIHGVPKPSYRAFQILHGLGTERLGLTWDASTASTLDAVATRSGSRIIVLACNHNVPKAPISAETLEVWLPESPVSSRAWVERIDEEHANPCRMWDDRGSPQYPDAHLIDDLVAGSALTKERLVVERGGGRQTVTLVVPPHGVAAITFESD